MLGKILEGLPGVKKEGAVYLVPEEIDAAAYISLGQEVLQIQRISRVDLGQDVVQFATHKGERFFFPPEEVVGFKFGGPEAKMSRTSAGFR
jgi:hypothetical protein